MLKKSLVNDQDLSIQWSVNYVEQERLTLFKQLFLDEFSTICINNNENQ